MKNSTYNLTLADLYQMQFDLAIEDSPAAFEHVLHFPNCRVAVYDRPWNQAAEFPNAQFVRCGSWDEIAKLASSFQPKYKENIKMELHDFTAEEQQQIKAGLSEAVISDKEAAGKILALVPEEWIKRIPFFVRGHATTKTIERIANQFPELYAVAKREGDLPEKEREELRKILTAIFEEKMKKHKML